MLAVKSLGRGTAAGLSELPAGPRGFPGLELPPAAPNLAFSPPRGAGDGAGEGWTKPGLWQILGANGSEGPGWSPGGQGQLQGQKKPDLRADKASRQSRRGFLRRCHKHHTRNQGLVARGVSWFLEKVFGAERGDPAAGF